MTKTVVNQAVLTCTKGDATSCLKVTSQCVVKLRNKSIATVEDTQASNIATFGMCGSSGNPDVAKATAAAQGVLTKQPCLPNILGTWAPSSTVVRIKQQQVLVEESQLTCMYGGEISITSTDSSGMMIK